jgi:hypothetical protein
MVWNHERDEVSNRIIRFTKGLDIYFLHHQSNKTSHQSRDQARKKAW